MSLDSLTVSDCFFGQTWGKKTCFWTLWQFWFPLTFISEISWKTAVGPEDPEDQGSSSKPSKVKYKLFFFKSTSDKRHKNTEVQVQLSWSFRQVKTITGQSSTATRSDRHSNLYQLIIQDYRCSNPPTQQKQQRAHRPRVGRLKCEDRGRLTNVNQRI